MGSYHLVNRCLAKYRVNLENTSDTILNHYLSKAKFTLRKLSPITTLRIELTTFTLPVKYGTNKPPRHTYIKLG